ncbi:MAG: RNA polymerase sigma-70 factor [Bacteroidales bacterium]
MNYSDTEVIEAIKNGNLKIFEQLFRLYYKQLCSFANKYLQSYDSAEEVVQDIFYQIWKKRNEINIKTSLKSYLFTSVKNNCLQQLRVHNLDLKYENYYKSHYNEESIDPSEELRAKELDTIISKALSSLPEKCRQIFEMSRNDGLKYHEIAAKLSISIKTVEANMGKALKHFRVYLKDYAEAI